LIVHAKELKRTTNTGVLATHALTNGEVLVRGRKDQPLSLASVLLPGFRPLLFFPTVGALDLTEDLVAESPLPIQLIVPDGNWRQAAKVAGRYPELATVPHVMIQRPNAEARHLRAESTPEGMATLQAIAQALAVIEGPLVGEQLMQLYRLKLERTLAGRGQ
jgi:DTW domain-containing protein YfiP